VHLCPWLGLSWFADWTESYQVANRAIAPHSRLRTRHKAQDFALKAVGNSAKALQYLGWLRTSYWRWIGIWSGAIGVFGQMNLEGIHLSRSQSQFTGPSSKIHGWSWIRVPRGHTSLPSLMLLTMISCNQCWNISADLSALVNNTWTIQLIWQSP